MGSKDSETNEELIAMPPGITIRMNPVSDTSKILSQLDSILSVTLVELHDQMKIIEGPILYYSNPYEQFCKENLSFLMKYLR
jgi:hypothetical protein